MELYDMLKNIYGKNNEEELQKAIYNVRNNLNGLTEERMCKVYSSSLLNELNSKHVPARLINTLDLGLEYEHLFVLVPSNETGYFLADLTFSQFDQNLDQLSELLNVGYQLIDDVNLNYYLNVIEKGKLTNPISVEDIFYSNSTFVSNQNNIKR